MEQAHRAVILQGSNIGDRLRNLDHSLQLIGEQVGSIRESSSVYETAPWGNTGQSSFLNRIVIVNTVLNAGKLLESLLAIEGLMGRSRDVKWEPRIIDLDILFYDQIILNSKNLTIPHPHISDRRFTLIPLEELMPEFIHPVLNQTISSLLAQCNDLSAVRKVSPEKAAL
jgi:2-amino-4-hydroxy-6-hydroxymethyldihydropteridine diphosphokinase